MVAGGIALAPAGGVSLIGSAAGAGLAANGAYIGVKAAKNILQESRFHSEGSGSLADDVPEGHGTYRLLQ